MFMYYQFFMNNYLTISNTNLFYDAHQLGLKYIGSIP